MDHESRGTAAPSVTGPSAVISRENSKLMNTPRASSEDEPYRECANQEAISVSHTHRMIFI